ncbi:MAG: FGGY-family carbohydrate kinase [Actinomycetota bacterium]|nr:FGGY-family carbohydrate kinase [Actinomycetota bacterium]
MTLVATIDAGGSGVKVGIMCLETWRMLAAVRREYAPVSREPGLLEWEPGEWWAAIEAALADAVATAGEPPERYAGLTCTGMRIPFVLVDDRGRPLAPGVLVPDVRGRVYLEELRSTIGAEQLYATTGHWIAPHFGLPKLLWFVRERAALWSRTRWVLQFCDWLLERLCGVVASEHSSASMSQMLDVKDRDWAGGLLDSAGIDAARLPPLCAAGTFAGGLRPEVARRVGLRGGTPVHVGGGDTHVACLAATGLDGDAITIVAGTTTPLMVATEQPWLDRSATPLVSAHVRADRWAAETNVSTSGAMLRWLRDLTGSDYATLERLAEASPLGAGGALVSAANPEWGAREWASVPPISLVGVGPGHGVGDLARATLESAAHAVACNFARLDSLAGHPEVDVVLTGGGSRSGFSAQMLADVLGRRVVVPELDDAAAVGGALLVAGLDRPGVQPPVRVHEPDAERHAAYVPLTRRYAEVFTRLRGADLGAAT